MADEIGAPPTGDTAPPKEVPKFAGKFTDEKALAKGINELRGTLGYTPLANPIGEDGTYKTPEEAEADYKALSKLIGAKAPAKPPDGKPAEPLKIGDVDVEADVPTILTKAGLQLTDLEQQFIKDGDLTDEQYKAIQKARPSLTKPDIKLIAEGMAAKAILAGNAVNTAKSEAAQIAGGEEQLATLLQSASSFLTPTERDDFNRRLQDPKLTVSAVKDLAARHAQAVGAGGGIVRGGTPAGPSLPKNSTEFSKLVQRASAGDQSAISIINATPQEHINKWSKA